MAELGFEFVVQSFRSSEAPGRFAAVGVVDRGWRANEIGAAAFTVEREPHSGSHGPVAIVENIPDLRLLDAVVPGGPHFDAALVAPIETVGDDAVFTRRAAGGHVGLHRAGDGRKAGYEYRMAA